MLTKLKNYALYCALFMTCQTNTYSAQEILALAPYALQKFCKHAPLVLFANACIPKERLVNYKDYPYRLGAAAMACYLAYQQQSWAQKLAAIFTGYDLLESSFQSYRHSVYFPNSNSTTTTKIHSTRMIWGTLYASIGGLFLWYHFWYTQ